MVSIFTICATAARNAIDSVHSITLHDQSPMPMKALWQAGPEYLWKSCLLCSAHVALIQPKTRWERGCIVLNPTPVCDAWLDKQHCRDLTCSKTICCQIGALKYG